MPPRPHNVPEGFDPTGDITQSNLVLSGSHEERIQKLEAKQSDSASAIATQTVQLEHLKATAEESKLSLHSIKETMAENFSVIIKGIEDLGKKDSEKETRLANLEKESKDVKDKHIARVENYKKVVVGIVIAASGALGKYVVDVVTKP